MAPTPTGMDLKVERIRAHATASSIASAMGVTRQRISAIEALATVTPEVTERYRSALMSLTSDATEPSEAVAS